MEKRLKGPIPNSVKKAVIHREHNELWRIFQWKLPRIRQRRAVAFGELAFIRWTLIERLGFTEHK
jgi:hypothetical protein